jgi:hypothetical protein
VDPRTAASFRRLLIRAATAAEDGSVASVSALERICYMVAEETPDLLLTATEYLWRKHRYSSSIEATEFIVSRVLRRFSVESTVVAISA